VSLRKDTLYSTASYNPLNSQGQNVSLFSLPPIPLSAFIIQTHTTPVLLGHRDRAELAGQEYSTLVSVMEGVVIVEKIPEQAVQT
jgi:26S proteasome regulatory subunit N1